MYFSLLFAFKCIHFDYVNNICNPINHNYNTRFANLNVELPPVARLSFISNSFVYKIPKMWNELSNIIKNEIRLEPFKRKLKHYLLNNQLLT